MKKLAVLLTCLVILSGCASGGKEMDRGMGLREKLLKAEGCCFDASVTADYGDKLYVFRMDCEADASGNLTFTVLEPKSIAGITGKFDGSGGALTFDDKVLAFPLLADNQLTPVSAPWIFLKTLRSGYLTSAGTEGETLRLSIDDSYAEDALHMDIWLDRADIPVRAEILYGERKILSLSVNNFEIR